jgi:small subunit ribosomal protein S4
VKYLENRPYPPGVHGRSRRTTSDYSVRLREKQRLRHQYNIREGQLRRAFEEARRRPGKTGDNLVAALETRLDATVLRAGLAKTIYQARQLVVHRHIEVNGSRVDRPSYRLSVGDIVGVTKRSSSLPPFLIAAADGYATETPPYLAVERSSLRAELIAIPSREQVPVICDEQLVVEFYSR